MARDFLRRARSRLVDGESALRRGDYPDAVRYSQECVELFLKACLRTVGVEYPKVHDVGDLLDYYEDRFPEWFRREIPLFKRVSRELALKRIPSVYGLESEGKPAGELFGREDAEEALESAGRVYADCEKFLNEFYDG